MLKIGLTGGIGCGKTTVAELFAAKGVPVIDADRVSRDLVEPGRPALDAIVQRFGPELLEGGRLNRARLRQIVFSAPLQRQWLEALLHPLVYEEMAARLRGLSAPYCLLVVPLLLETGRRDFVDRLLVVDCPAKAQRQRIKARDGLDDSELQRVLSAQLARQDRLAAADDVIENAGGPEDLAAQVDRLHRSYLALAGAKQKS